MRLDDFVISGAPADPNRRHRGSQLRRRSFWHPAFLGVPFVMRDVGITRILKSKAEVAAVDPSDPRLDCRQDTQTTATNGPLISIMRADRCRCWRVALVTATRRYLIILLRTHRLRLALSLPGLSSSGLDPSATSLPTARL